MADLIHQSALLAKADADIALGEARIARQRMEIATLRRDGHDTRSATALLEAFEHSLRLWQACRAQLRRVSEAAERRRTSHSLED